MRSSRKFFPKTKSGDRQHGLSGAISEFEGEKKHVFLPPNARTGGAISPSAGEGLTRMAPPARQCSGLRFGCGKKAEGVPDARSPAANLPDIRVARGGVLGWLSRGAAANDATLRLRLQASGFHDREEEAGGVEVERRRGRYPTPSVDLDHVYPPSPPTPQLEMYKLQPSGYRDPECSGWFNCF